MARLTLASLMLVLVSLGLAIIPLSGAASAQTIGPWAYTTPYPTISTGAPNGTLGQSCAISGGDDYCVGGASYPPNPAPTDHVYYAAISSSGIGTWTNTTAYPLHIYLSSCVTWDAYIYCVGGLKESGGINSVSNAVYSAPISSSGVGAWTAQGNYPTTVEATSCVVWEGYMTCVAGLIGIGVNTDVVYSASLSGGTVGTWNSQNHYPATDFGIEGESCVSLVGAIFCIGGQYNPNVSGDINASVWHANLSAGIVGAWAPNAGYPVPIAYAGCTTPNVDPPVGYIYCVGGYGGTSSESVYIGTELIGAVTWAESASSYLTPVEAAQCGISGNYLYCVGGQTSDDYYSLIRPASSSTTTVSCTLTTFAVGIGSTCTATVNGFSPTGTVTFTQSGAGGVTFGTGGVCTLSPSGSCAVTATGATAGAVTIQGSYGGDGNNIVSLGTEMVTVTLPPPPPLLPICPSTAGGTYLSVGATFQDGAGNAWAAPGGTASGGTFTSYFFAGSQGSIPAPMLQGWAGVYGTYGGQAGWIVTFYC
ncbi:MAG: hypothetical protein ABSF83_14835 [Nitrososphaerales archaeon]